MEPIYPAGPEAVPRNLTRPTIAYRCQAWLATAGLLLFVGLYFGLAAWFCKTAWSLIVGFDPNEGSMMQLVGGACAAFLAVFMLKSVFFVNRGQPDQHVEVTPAQQPDLFAFLYRLADEARAPRPHRVFVSGGVNAAVFYDLSLANLLFRSRKNLEIGLGLVNVLDLSELKAVLAHEFGHFAQRTMAVGRWVYVAQQIAGHLVARRDALDGLLEGLSSVDIRIGWVGWILRIIVWSIRSLVDMAFRGVIVAQRALSREMEFQADLVAVSLTGSDALIHALHRLIGADDAWTRSLHFAESEFREGRPVQDLFAVQSRIIEWMRHVLGDSSYAGLPPEAAAVGGERPLFKAALAAPPRMWMTHPSNLDREQNAKRIYIPAPLDNREAWALFREVTALRQQVTANMARGVEYKPIELEKSLARVDEDFGRAYLDPDYRGLYLGRSVTRYGERVEDLYAPSAPAGVGTEQLDALYPESLRTELRRLQELQQECSTLEALRVGLLKAPGGVIRRQGDEITKKDLPRVIDTVQKELDGLNASIQEHDRRCRSAHLEAARQFGEGWVEYLEGLLRVLHYADHTIADLLDAHRVFSNTLAVLAAGGKINAKDLGELLRVGGETYVALRRVHEHAGEVVLDPALQERFGTSSWSEALGKLELPAPSRENIVPWLNAESGWVHAAAKNLDTLRLAALEQLLGAEKQVAQHVQAGSALGTAPIASRVPGYYPVLLPGRERRFLARLTWWDRFQLADGLLPAAARVAVALAIVGSVVLVGSHRRDATVVVYNGIGRPVTVDIDKAHVDVAPFSFGSIEMPPKNQYHIRARTQSGEVVDEFDAQDNGRVPTRVYNVARAGVLVEWTAVYGEAPAAPPLQLENARWVPTKARVLFTDPPKSLAVSGGGQTRRVLSGLSGELPIRVLSWVSSDSARTALIMSHARWDASDTRHINSWLNMASESTSFPQILAARLAESPRDPIFLRLEQDMATEEERQTLCERHQRLAADWPGDPSLQYIAARCIDDRDRRREILAAHHARWPTHPWLAMAVGWELESEGEWREAIELFRRARPLLPAMEEVLVVEEARLRRLLSNDERASLRDLIPNSESLELKVALETGGDNLGGSAAAYPKLARGDLTGALSAAREPPSWDPDPRLLRLVAASDGASADMRHSALALPFDAGLDPTTLWPSLALAARDKRDLTPYLARVNQEMRDDAPAMLRAFETLHAHGSAADFEKSLAGLAAYQRGLLYAAAVVLRGEDCPVAWRASARQLLFVSERPFLGAPERVVR